MSPQLHRKTPTISAIDSRGLPVRHIAYWRRTADDSPAARISRHTHDVAGRLVAQWDPRLFADKSNTNANLMTVYSLGGKPLRVESVDAGWRLNLPGGAGEIVHSWDQRGSHVQTTYDDQLRPVDIQEQTADGPLRTVECFSYGDNSMVAARHNRCGALIRHDDAAGALLIHEYAVCGKPAGQTRRFLIDPRQAFWPADVKDRDALLEEGEGHETSWRYDALGETLQQTDAAGHRQRFSFDVAGQLKTISLLIKDATTEQVILKDLLYDAFGHVESQTAGNGAVSRAVLDPASGRLTSLRASLSSSTLQDLHYTYDAVGNVTRIEDKAQPVQFGGNQRVEAVSTFSYDSLYQLLSATGREAAGQDVRVGLPSASRAPIDARQLFNFTEHYDYDTGGNLTELRHVREGNTYTRTLNVATASNHLLSWNRGDATPRLNAGFDANGNQQALNPGQALEWNARNQLASVMLVSREDGRHDMERYSYDSSGQRVRKIQTMHAASVMHTREVRYLPGLEIRTRNNERLEVVTLQAGRFHVRYLHWTEGRPVGMPGNPLRYSLNDHLGSSSLELDDQGWLISQDSYLPYGGTAWSASRSEVEADYRTLRYSGKERDASGLYYYGHRYYATWLQRWISPDPSGAIDGLNLYCMVGNNPLRYADTRGTNKEETTIKEEIASYPSILSELQERVGTLNYQLYNGFEKKDIYKRYAQTLGYNLARSATATVAGVGGAVLGPAGYVAASAATSIAIDAVAKKSEATRHLPFSLVPHASRLDPEAIEQAGRTAFYNVYSHTVAAVKEHDIREPGGQKKPALILTRFLLGKVLELPGAWVSNFEASVQVDTALRGLAPRKIEKLNNALCLLDEYLKHDEQEINQAFGTLGVQEFYPENPLGTLKFTVDQATNKISTSGSHSIKNSEIQSNIHIARATIQRGRELLFRHAQSNKMRPS